MVTQKLYMFQFHSVLFSCYIVIRDEEGFNPDWTD